MRPRCLYTLLLTLSVSVVAFGKPADPPLVVRDLAVKGRIEGENITFDLTFTVDVNRRRQRLALVSGDLVMLETNLLADGRELEFDPGTQTYSVHWPRTGSYPVSFRFAGKPKLLEDRSWRETEFVLPASRLRQLEVICDRTDLEVTFPGALRVQRDVRADELTMTAVLGAGRPFAVRWKPHVEELEAKLVFASEGNTIAMASAGALRLDSLFVLDISQGKMDELKLIVPADVSVTQVRGKQIRDWRIEKEEGNQFLYISFTRPLTERHAFQVLAEMALSTFPVEVALASIEPVGCIRAAGAFAIGTNSAIQLLIRQLSGLSQVDAAAFPRMSLDPAQERALPTGKSFFYLYAAAPAKLTCSLDDIVSSFDVSERLHLNVKEDDLTIEADVELDVREAPLRDIKLSVPAAFVVSDVVGKQVSDYTVSRGDDQATTQDVQVFFGEPLTGRALIHLRLEYGRGALGVATTVEGFRVAGAKTERGYVVLTTDQGIQVDQTTPGNLREVHTGSVPMRVANAQYAYRFRDNSWRLEVTASAKPPAIRTELFQLVSLGEGVLYGSVAVSYFISGAPLDEFRFQLPDGLANLEFVGRDVRRWSREGEGWVVELQRKVLGDYNLGITYTGAYETGAAVQLGGVRCLNVDTQTGYVAVASHLHLDLAPPADTTTTMMEVRREEIPANYRLLINAPLLKSYKYVGRGDILPLAVTSYQRGDVLPIAIEVMELNTQVGIRKTGETESITRVRYKLKNSSEQSLALRMPAGATPWSTRLVERDRRGKETRTELHARQEGETLLIPLKRYHNPNAPLTLELEYGEDHGKRKLTAPLPLSAPRPAVQATFATWQVSVPSEWAVLSGENTATMAPESVEHAGGGLVPLVRAATQSWKWVGGELGDEFGGGVVSAAGLATLAVLIVLLIFQPAIAPWFFVGVVTALVLGAGIAATNAPSFLRGVIRPETFATVNYTRAVSTAASGALEIRPAITPFWKCGADLYQVIGAGALAVVGLLAGILVRRVRPLLWAAGLTCALWGAAQLPVSGTAIAHALVWGVPALLALRVLILFVGVMPRRWLHDSRRWLYHSGTPFGMLSLFVLWCGPAQADDGSEEAPAAPVSQSVSCALVAEQDCIAGEMTLTVVADAPLRVPLFGESGVVLSDRRLDTYLTLLLEGGKYVLDVGRRGRYVTTVSFLMPLPEPTAEQVSTFTMPLPPALTNRVTLSVPKGGVRIASPGAIHFVAAEEEGESTGTAVFAPGSDVVFEWRPRARQVELEPTAYYADVISVVRFDAGLAEGRHRVRFQVAQGQLRDVSIILPEGATVTALRGEDVGAWRFDPGERLLEVKLTSGASGEYLLDIVTQMPNAPPPLTVKVGVLDVKGAAQQRGVLGLAVSAAVHAEVSEHPQLMNLDDFVRDGGVVAAASLAGGTYAVRHAFRYRDPGESVTVALSEVMPELRAVEAATFTVSDERLVYNAELTVDIEKAGVFTIGAALPDGYDIDALAVSEMSHWDEETGPAGARRLQIHLSRKMTGQISLKLTLSRSVAELPELITVPRVSVEEALKHTGQVTVTSDRGVRLSVAERTGVSEQNPVEAGIREQTGLVFRLLNPAWRLVLRPEVLQPRVIVDFLHVANVSDGLVRHAHRFLFKVHNAGTKVLEVQVQPGALGLLLEGPDIAHMDEVGEGTGRWRVELARKWHDRAYPLKASYETRFDQGQGQVQIQPISALGVELQRGYVTVQTSARVALALQASTPSLQPADARNVPRSFGEGNLSDAAFCFRATSPDYSLTFAASRPGAADLLEAQVTSTSITSVITESGEAVNRVVIAMQVGAKRHLEVTLPSGADIWTLQVDRRATVPSVSGATAGGDVFLIPLGSSAGSLFPVQVDFIYVVPPASDWRPTRHHHQGPKVDLPLRNVEWLLYLPTAYEYEEFAGTLTVDEGVVKSHRVRHYDIAAYEEVVTTANAVDVRRAKELQDQAGVLAQQGQQYAAKQALRSAWHYSVSDQTLNEDARVQLHRLNREQALVGLVGRRGHLRQQGGHVAGEAGGGAAQQDLGDRFNVAEAQQLQNSLSKSDSENLEMITERFVEMQEAAAAAKVQLLVNMPVRGRTIRFHRPLQVQPQATMEVTFSAKRRDTTAQGTELAGAAAVFVLLLFCLGLRPPRSRGPTAFPESKPEVEPGAGLELPPQDTPLWAGEAEEVADLRADDGAEVSAPDDEAPPPSTQADEETDVPTSPPEEPAEESPDDPEGPDGSPQSKPDEETEEKP